MSQALRIDPTVIETYSAMLFIDRSGRFGADTPNNAFVPLEAGGPAVPMSATGSPATSTSPPSAAGSHQ